MKKNLTKNTIKKYKLIIDEWFVNDFNGKKAYQKYYKNATDNTATSNFSKLKNYPELKKYFNEKHAFARENSSMSQKEIVRNLEVFARMDVTSVLNYTDVERKGVRTIVNPNYNPDKEGSKETIEEEYIYYSREIVIKDFEDLSEKQRLSITSVKQGKFGVEIEFFSKVRAYDMLNKHKGVYKEDNEQKASAINITATNEEDKDLIQSIIDGTNEDDIKE